jgi:hypothetical protein
MRWLLLLALAVSAGAAADAVDRKYQAMVKGFKTPYVQEAGETISKVEYRNRTIHYTHDITRERMLQIFRETFTKEQVAKIGSEMVGQLVAASFNIEGHKKWCVNTVRYDLERDGVDVVWTYRTQGKEGNWQVMWLLESKDYDCNVNRPGYPGDSFV